VWQDGAAESGGAGVLPAYEEAIVRNAVRKFVGVALVGLLGALALPMLAAGAQTATTNGSSGSNGIPPDPPGDCSFTVTPNPIPALGTQVTINGTAPTSDNAHVVLIADGVPAVPQSGTDVVEADPAANGSYTLLYTVNAQVGLSVSMTFGNQNAYAADCIGPGGITVVRVTVKAADVTKPPAAVQPAAQALAFTGSSDTPSYVLIGIAAIVVGAVLVVAARRRSQVS
jgi:LPXTG-motif cell wall-anchored protein